MRGSVRAAGWRTQNARSENLLMKSNPFAVSATWSHSGRKLPAAASWLQSSAIVSSIA